MLPSPASLLPSQFHYSRFAEAIIRLGYYGYISYTLFNTIFDVDLQDRKVLIGAVVVYMMFQFFLLHHLVQGIRLLSKHSARFYPMLTFSSGIGLLVFITAMVRYGILAKGAPFHEPYFMSTLLLFCIVAPYLCYKEILLLITHRNRLLDILKKNI